MIISRKKIACLVLAIISTIIYVSILSKILGSFEPTLDIFKPFFFVLLWQCFLHYMKVQLIPIENSAYILVL